MVGNVGLSKSFSCLSWPCPSLTFKLREKKKTTSSFEISGLPAVELEVNLAHSPTQQSYTRNTPVYRQINTESGQNWAFSPVHPGLWARTLSCLRRVFPKLKKAIQSQSQLDFLGNMIRKPLRLRIRALSCSSQLRNT